MIGPLFRILSFFAIFSVVFTTSCADSEGERHIEGVVWNTTYHITYTGRAGLEDSVTTVLDMVGRSLSMWDEGSLVSRVNASPSGTVRADSLLRRVIGMSRQVGAASGGVFDPTVQPLVNLWGFGPRGVLPGSVPSHESVDSVLGLVGIAACGVGADGTVVKKHDLTGFDFSAIAKGMACDLVGEMLLRNGCGDYMVEIGGEVVTRGLNPRRLPWRIQVDAPVAGDDGAGHVAMTVIEPGDAGVATSGNYRNFRDTDGGRVGHTIDPLTGMPAQTSMLSATVVAPTCMEADALATACMAMRPETAAGMIARRAGCGALLVWRGDVGGMCVRAVGRWPGQDCARRAR